MDEEEAAGPCLLLVHSRSMDWLRLKPFRISSPKSAGVRMGNWEGGAWGFQAEHWKRQR